MISCTSIVPTGLFLNRRAPQELLLGYYHTVPDGTISAVHLRSPSWAIVTSSVTGLNLNTPSKFLIGLMEVNPGRINGTAAKDVQSWFISTLSHRPVGTM